MQSQIASSSLVLAQRLRKTHNFTNGPLRVTKGNNMKKNAPPTIDALLRLPEVESLVGLKRSSIYRAVKNGSFPAPVKLGARASGFPASKVQQWIADRINGVQRAA